MSFAIALDNSPENVGNIQSTLQILRNLRENNSDHPAAVNSEEKLLLEELIDWYEDMHKVLTEYSMFEETSSQEV